MSVVEDKNSEHGGGPSLGSRLGVSVDKLDFGYIMSCKDVKELEKILKVLRSGEEGTFPDLERKAEERLQALNPKSRLLRKEEQVLKSSDLRPEESSAVADELSSWLLDMSHKDQQLKLDHETSDRQQCSKELPPVRNSSTNVVRTSVQTEAIKVASNKTPSQKTPKPREYREWDKLISTLDKEADLPEPAAAPNSTPSPASKPSKPPGLKDTLDCVGLTDVEKEKLSQQEKEKGNEALKSGSFAEAVTYYGRSITAYSTTAAHNNRALAYIKMEKWTEAISDCDYVLKNEEHDVKALLRRATAFKGQCKYAAAKSDIDLVLTLEPNNRQAAELLASISKHLLDEVSQKKDGVPRRLVIEETDGEESDTEGSSICNNTKEAGDARTPKQAHEDAASPGDLTRELETHIGAYSKALANSDLSLTSLPTNQTGVSTSPASSAASGDRTLVLSEADGPTTSRLSSVHAEQEEEPTTVTPIAEPTVITVSPLPSTVSLLSSKGGTLFKAGQYGDAKTFYDQAIKELRMVCGTDGDPAHPYSYHLSSLYSNRAACHFKTGDPRSCISDCAAALELVLHSPKPLLRRAQAYEQLEKYAEAFADYRHYLVRTAIDGGGDAASAQQGASRCQSCLQQQHGQKWRDHIPKIPSVTNLPAYEFAASSNELSNEKSSTETPLTIGQRECQTLPSKTPVVATVGEAITTANTLQSYESVKNEGNMFFKKGNYQEAIRCYSRAIELAPELDVCYANRAECHLRLGQAQQAALDASKAVRCAPDNVKALYRHARACKMLGRFDESRELYEKVLQLDKSNKEAQQDLELVKAAQAKKLQTGASHRLKIVEASSDESDTETAIESSTGDSSSEANQGSKLEKSPNSGPTSIRSAKGASENTNNTTERTSDGTSPRQTVSSIAKGATKMLEHSHSQQSAVAALKRGKQHQEAGELAKAVAAYNEAIDVLHGNEEDVLDFLLTLYCDRAACHLELGDSAACMADCNAALKLNPHAAQPAQLLQQALAAAQVEKGCFDTGGLTGPVSESSSAAQPAGAAPHHATGEIKQECSGSRKGGGLAESCLARGAASIEMNYEQVKEKGRQLVAENNFQKAVDVYSEGLMHFGADAVLHTNRALCHLRLGQYTDAVADCNAALQLDSTNVKALYRLGLAEKHRKNYQESLRAFNSVRQYDKNNKEVLREQNAVKELYRQYLEELKSQSEKQPSCSMGSRSSGVGNGSSSSSSSNNPKSKATKTKLSSGSRTGITAGSYSSSPAQGHKPALVTGQAWSSGASVEVADDDRLKCGSCPMSHRKHNGDTGITSASGSKAPGSKSSASDTTPILSRDGKSTVVSPKPAQSTDDAPRAYGRDHVHMTATHKPSKITSTSFMQEWHRLKSQRGSLPYADLLRKIAPGDIPDALTNQIDGEFLSKIVCTLKEHFTSSAEDLGTACEILKNISRVSRFNMAKVFLSSGDRIAIEEIVKGSLQNGVNVSASGLREAYGI